VTMTAKLSKINTVGVEELCCGWPHRFGLSAAMRCGDCCVVSCEGMKRGVAKVSISEPVLD
jgi:hypothetical protein